MKQRRILSRILFSIFLVLVVLSACNNPQPTTPSLIKGNVDFNKNTFSLKTSDGSIELKKEALQIYYDGYIDAGYGNGKNLYSVLTTFDGGLKSKRSPSMSIPSTLLRSETNTLEYTTDNTGNIVAKSLTNNFIFDYAFYEKKYIPGFNGNVDNPFDVTIIRFNLPDKIILPYEENISFPDSFNRLRDSVPPFSVAIGSGFQREGYSKKGSDNNLENYNFSPFSKGKIKIYKDGDNLKITFSELLSNFGIRHFTQVVLGYEYNLFFQPNINDGIIDNTIYDFFNKIELKIDNKALSNQSQKKISNITVNPSNLNKAWTLKVNGSQPLFPGGPLYSKEYTGKGITTKVFPDGQDINDIASGNYDVQVYYTEDATKNAKDNISVSNQDLSNLPSSPPSTPPTNDPSSPNTSPPTNNPSSPNTSPPTNNPSSPNTPPPTNNPSTPNHSTTPNPTPSKTPKPPKPTPTPIASDFEPFSVYSTVSSNDDDLSDEIAKAEGLNNGLIAREYGFRVTANTSPRPIRTKYELGKGKIRRVGTTITLYSREATSAIVGGNVSILDSKDKSIVTFPRFGSTVLIKDPTFIERKVNGGKDIIRIAGFKGSYRPGVDGLDKYYWYGRDSLGAGPDFVETGDYEVKTKFDIIYIGRSAPLPLQNTKAIIQVTSDFPDYTNVLPKQVSTDRSEHIRAGHRFDYLTQVQYNNLIALYNLYSNKLTEISGNKVRKAIGGPFEKDGCFNNGWNDSTVFNIIKDVANMNDINDKWTDNGGQPGIRIFGTRSSNGYSHKIVVVIGTDSNGDLNDQTITAYSENQLDAIKESKVMQDYSILLKDQSGRNTLSSYLLNK